MTYTFRINSKTITLNLKNYKIIKKNMKIIANIIANKINIVKVNCSKV
jgi:hypothetical protein